MINGIGIDMIEVERIADRVSRKTGFRELVFSPSEIEYCQTKAHAAEHYAARFAAKEAFFKALGTGWKNGTAFNEIEIIHDAAGKPSFRLLGKTAETLAHLRMENITVSLSHIRSVATAIVIIEEGKNGLST